MILNHLVKYFAQIIENSDLIQKNKVTTIQKLTPTTHMTKWKSDHSKWSQPKSTSPPKYDSNQNVISSDMTLPWRWSPPSQQILLTLSKKLILIDDTHLLKTTPPPPPEIQRETKNKL